MALWDKLKNEFVDIIDWTDGSQDTIVWRFPRHQNEIKYGAQLTVRESQMAVFINEGQVADVFEPGMYTLTTQNMPILTTLKGWKYGFNSPFKAEVYFVNTKNFIDCKWGTTDSFPPIRDKEFGMIRLKGHGNYTFRVTDPGKFIKEVSGTDGHFTVDEVSHQLRDMIVAGFGDALGSSNIPVLDLLGNFDELGQFVKAKMNPEFLSYGLEVTKFFIKNISFPEAIKEAIDKKSSMGILGDLNQYAQFQAANAMEAAAKNPGGDAGAGIGMGMGFAMANQMGKMYTQPQAAAPAPAAQENVPPPIPGSVSMFVAIDGEQAGPFKMDTILSMIDENRIDKDTLVWKKGMSDWSPAKEVPNLSALFDENTPPPLPPGQ